MARARHAMPLYEYSRWDGSQGFQPQSADAAFDRVAEWMLHHGDQVLRHLERLEDDAPEILDLIQKEGLLEQDEAGQWRVSPKGVRRIQQNALLDLFQTFQRDALGKHDTPQKGEGTVRLEDSK